MKPVHFLLRVPRLTRVESSPPISLNTIECHEELIRARGFVTVAKFGQPSTVAIVKKLNEQIADDVRTYLILVTRIKTKEIVGFEFPIVSILRGSATDNIKNSSPKYYQELSYGAGLWFTVRGPMKACNLVKLRLASSGKPILDILTKSRTPSMLVTRED
jgi:hypothetical protein